MRLGRGARVIASTALPRLLGPAQHPPAGDLGDRHIRGITKTDQTWCPVLRSCFRDPIPEILEAATYLDKAVSAHLAGNAALAEALIKRSDIPAIRKWTDSIWGAKSPYVVKALSRSIDTAPVRVAARMPNFQEKRALHLRDGYRCRFCGIPVIRREVRIAIGKKYPAAYWGNKNVLQHAAFQAMWAQYDHIVPHSRGGSNDLNNLVITCAPCNFGRMECTLAEVSLADPRERDPIKSSWDGLERFLQGSGNGVSHLPPPGVS